MVGGGPGAFIGAVHRMAARLEGRYELVRRRLLERSGARACRGRAARAWRRSASTTPIRRWRGSKAARPDGIEAVVIVTPNHLHYPVAKAFLEAGIHVICDKPLTTTLTDALALRDLVRASGRLFFVTYTYGTYPMVAQAREMVRGGQLGTVRVVQVEYAQGWLSTALETRRLARRPAGAPIRHWPATGGCLGDIGTHAYHLVEFVTGLRTQSVAAELTSFVPGRRLDDNVQVLLRFVGGAKGALWASQVAAGEDNALRIRIYGDQASVCWDQEHPEELRFAPLGRAATDPAPWRSRRRALGQRGDPPAASDIPKGTLEGFGLLYSEVADAHYRGSRAAAGAGHTGGDDRGGGGGHAVHRCLRALGARRMRPG